jgi:2-dehydropantoate 2-reductase
MTQRIAVVGAGAIGGHLAAKLARAGNQVSVVARGAHLEAIRANGLVFEAGSERYVAKVNASQRGADLGPQDVVFVAGKAQHLPGLAAEIPPLLGPDTPVVFAINGVPWWYFHRFGNRPWRRIERLDPDGAIEANVPRERVLGAVVNSSNAVTAPGHVHNVTAHRNRFLLCEPDDTRTARAEKISALLTATGLEAPIAENSRRELWQKLLVNMGNSAACCLTGATVGEMLRDGEAVQVARRINEEAVQIAASHGIALQPGYSPEQVKATLGSPVSGHKPSMLQDLEAGKPIELDAQFVVPQDFARDAGIATPTLDTVIALLRLRAQIATG